MRISPRTFPSFHFKISLFTTLVVLVLLRHITFRLEINSQNLLYSIRTMSTYATALTFAQRQAPPLLPNGNVTPSISGIHRTYFLSGKLAHILIVALMLTRLHLQSSKPLRPIDVRIQSQLSQLRDRISTTETALRELHAYRDSIPDGPYHSQVMDYEKQIDQANEMIAVSALYPPPPGAPHVSPLDPKAPWVRLQRQSLPPTMGTNAIDEFTNMSKWLMKAKDEFVQKRIANVPSVDIPEEQRDLEENSPCSTSSSENQIPSAR
ncbi:hypothetical protein CPB85DRAFT_1319889 [Mucidula mucida]|nr:hypothetical protein CPB85DRAFT_1319889 [Mucidula mucida]